VRLKSRFTPVGIIVALAAMMAIIVTAVPAFAGTSIGGGAIVLQVQGGTGTGVEAGVTQDTRVGTTLYVANSSAAFNQVLITVTHAASNAAAGAVDTISVTVTNQTTNTSISGGRTLTETGNNTGIFTGTIFVVATVASATTDIATSDGNTIRVAFSATGDVANMTVDTVKPTIAVSGPAHNTITRSTTIDFSATITDAGSGMRPDTNTLSTTAPGSSTSSDHDGNGISANEPIKYGVGVVDYTGTSPFAKGQAVDVKIRRILQSTIATPSADVIGVTGTDFSETALWTPVTNGFSLLSTRLLTSGTHWWNIAARDRAGNIAATDADAVITGSQAFKLTIDTSAPSIATAQTGKGYDATNKKTSTSADRTSIKLTFTDANGADFLNAATVSAASFAVAGNTVTGVIYPNHPVDPNIAGSEDLRNTVFLKLASELTGNAKPKVTIFGAVQDLAGNTAAAADFAGITDGIPARFTVTVNGQTTRQIVKGTTGNEAVIRVVSDEPLGTAPSVILLTVANAAVANADVLVAGQASSTLAPAAVSGLANTWEVKQTAGAPAANGLIWVVVTGTDVNGIASGAAPTAGSTKVNLATATLFEVDSAIASPAFVLTPAPAGTPNTTESKSPFIRINFSERAEYSLATAVNASGTPFDRYDCGTPTGGTATCSPTGAAVAVVGATPTSQEIDTGNAVTLTSLKIDGADVLAGSTLVSGTTDSFIVAAKSLSIGTHTLTVTATDVSGNALASQAYVFTVIDRKPYSVPLSPGYNLISLPGNPVDKSIDAVIPPSHPATSVLTYAPTDPKGPWLVATRGASGNWTGTLTTITSNRAYWVQTTAFTPISTLIPERDPAAVLPTIAVTTGWNLLPVTDLTLSPAGGGPGGLVTTPAVYFGTSFANISVIYTFSTTTNAWQRVGTAAHPNILNGTGYWVWFTRDGTFVP